MKDRAPTILLDQWREPLETKWLTAMRRARFDAVPISAAETSEIWGAAEEPTPSLEVEPSEAPRDSEGGVERGATQSKNARRALKSPSTAFASERATNLGRSTALILSEKASSLKNLKRAESAERNRPLETSTIRGVLQRADVARKEPIRETGRDNLADVRTFGTRATVARDAPKTERETFSSAALVNSRTSATESIWSNLEKTKAEAQKPLAFQKFAIGRGADQASFEIPLLTFSGTARRFDSPRNVKTESSTLAERARESETESFGTEALFPSRASESTVERFITSTRENARVKPFESFDVEKSQKNRAELLSTEESKTGAFLNERFVPFEFEEGGTDRASKRERAAFLTESAPTGIDLETERWTAIEELLRESRDALLALVRVGSRDVELTTKR